MIYRHLKPHAAQLRMKHAVSFKADSMCEAVALAARALRQHDSEPCT